MGRWEQENKNRRLPQVGDWVWLPNQNEPTGYKASVVLSVTNKGKKSSFTVKRGEFNEEISMRPGDDTFFNSLEDLYNMVAEKAAMLECMLKKLTGESKAQTEGGVA